MASADLLYQADNVRCYFGPQMQQVVTGTMQVFHVPQSPEMFFIQITSDESKSSHPPLTIPLVPGYTRVDQHQGLYQVLISNSEADMYQLQLLPETPQFQLMCLGDVLMQIVAFPDHNQVVTGYQAPLKQSVAPHSLALVAPTGDVLGVLSSSFHESAPLTGPASNPVIVDTATNQVSSVDANTHWAITGAAYVSAGIVFGAKMLGTGLKAGSQYLVKNTTPNPVPSTISPTTKQRVDQLAKYSQTAVGISHATVSKVRDYTKKIGERVGQSFESRNAQGKPSGTWSLVKNVAQALDMMGDSIDYGIKSLASDSKQATSQFVGHKYGPSAQSLAETSMGIVENATLIYVDARGLSRRAILKAIGKGAVKYELKDGRDVTMEPLENGSLQIVRVDEKK